MKKSTLYGFAAIGFSIAYLITSKNDKNSNSIDGLEIKINPERLVDGALAITDIDSLAREGIRKVAKNAIKKIYKYDK